MIEKIIEKYPFLTIEDFKLSSQEEDAKPIIGKRGIDKLESELGIIITIQEQSLRPYNFISKKGGHEAAVAASVVVTGRRARANGSEPTLWEIGTAHHRNNDWPYEGEVAYKRARARVVMRIAGISTDDVITEDEFYEKLRGGSKSVSEQLSQLGQPIDDQDIKRAEEIKEKIKGKLSQSDQERTLKNNKTK